MSKTKAEKELARLEEDASRDLKITKVVRGKVRYFRDGAVLGSRRFANKLFESQRESFSVTRKDGARRPRGSLKDLAGEIWSLRDLKDELKRWSQKNVPARENPRDLPDGNGYATR